MIQQKSNFDARLKSVGRKHRALSRGYTTHLRSDGLIVVRPRRRGVEIPVKGIVFLLIGFFFFKAFVLASVGPQTYGERLALLNNGTILEQGGAWVLQADPVTQAAANAMGPILRY